MKNRIKWFRIHWRLSYIFAFLMVTSLVNPLVAEDDEIVIEAEPEDDGRYIRNKAPGVLKSDVDIMDDPHSVQVVPEKVFRDQQVTNLRDASRNVSNVTEKFPGANIRDSISIRGFQLTNLLIDGQPNITTVVGFAPREMAQFSRIEVLKGPASVTFGAVEPGGVLNLVTKKPQGEAAYELELSHGRWNNYNAIADFTGPLNEDRTLLYRTIAVYRSSESFRDEVQSDRVFFAPAITWLVTPSSTLTFYAHYQEDNAVSDWGVPSIKDPYTAAARDTYNAVAPAIMQQLYPAKELFPHEYTVDPMINSKTYFGNKNDNLNEQNQGSFGYNWETDFGNWLLQHRTRGESASVTEGIFYNNGIQADNRTTDRAFADRAYYMGSYNTQVSLSGKFKSGDITHRPHFGLDLAHAYYRAHVADNLLDAGSRDIYLSPAERAAVNQEGLEKILYLQYFDPPADPTSLASPLPVEQTLRANYGGAYGRYQVSFGDFLHISAGLRYDHVAATIHDENYKYREMLFFIPSIASTLYTNPEETEIKGDFLSPQAGILIRPWKFLSFFVSASESYNHDFTTIIGSKLVPRPIRSVGYEGGFKLQLFGEDLIATVTGFEITKTNVVIQDPFNVGQLIQSGEHVHRGAEIDILATPVAGLNLIASYGYIDAKITRDDTIDPTTGQKLLEGNRPGLVPEFNGNAWIVYEFQSGSLQGLGLGGGVYHVSSRYAQEANELVLPEYTIGSALLYYRMEQGKLSLTMKNVTNRRYYESANSRNGIIEGRPFEAIVSLKLNF